jgi:phage terminase large subunit
MKITYRKNGNEIIFTGLDDVEKLKSIYNITIIWIEEASELDAIDFRQLDIRLRGRTESYKQIIFTFNPISITHWLKAEFFDKKKKNSTTSHTTYEDNKFLDEEQIEVLEGFKETDPYYYQVYCKGEWGVLGKTVFPARIVTDRIIELRKQKPLKSGYFTYEEKDGKIVNTSIEFFIDKDGPIQIYEDVKTGYPYVIGGDTAGDGSDNFTAQVINNVDLKHVAKLRQEFDEDIYAKQVYCLGIYYNVALLSIETNYSTYPVKEIDRLGYTNQYLRQKEDTFTGKLKKSYGFNTNTKTRPAMIANLIQIVRDNIEWMNDIDTLDEMLTFVRNEKGKAEAQQGKHDDLIIGLAIAYYSRNQQGERVSVKYIRPDYIEEDDLDYVSEEYTSFF